MTSKRPPGRFHAAIGEHLKAESEGAGSASSASERLAKMTRGSAPPSLLDPGSLPDSGMPDMSSLPAPEPSPAPATRVPDSSSLPELGKVKVERLYHKTLNVLIDEVLATLPPAAQIAYIHLYRLSYGNGRNWCRIGHPKLAERAGIGGSTIRRGVEHLVRRGLVRIAQQEYVGSQRGTVYYLPPPPGTPADSIRLLDSDRLPGSSRPSDSGTMKEVLKESHETRSVTEIRTVGARLRELEQPASHAALVEAIRRHFAIAGESVDEVAIEAALKGSNL